VRLPGVLTVLESARLVRLGERLGFTSGDTVGGGRVGRRNHICWLDHTVETADVYATVQRTFEASAECFGVELSEMELIQLARYDVGDCYDWHSDVTLEEPERRRLSMSIELSSPDAYRGGELSFLDHDVPGRPDRGSALIFEPGLAHQVAPVVYGARYALVAWAA